MIFNEPELLGLFNIFWQEKVLDKMGVPFLEELANVFNTAEIVNRPYNAYKAALKAGYKTWNSNKPNQDLINYMSTIDTKDSKERIKAFLDAIYSLTLTGDIPSNIITGEGSASQIAQTVLMMDEIIIKPLSETAASALETTTKPLTKVLIPGAIIAGSLLIGVIIYKAGKAAK